MSRYEMDLLNDMFIYVAAFTSGEFNPTFYTVMEFPWTKKTLFLDFGWSPRAFCVLVSKYAYITVKGIWKTIKWAGLSYTNNKDGKQTIWYSAVVCTVNTTIHSTKGAMASRNFPSPFLSGGI